MERLICVFALIGATLACQPVTKPREIGRGNTTVTVYLTSGQPYDPAKVEEYMGYFADTMIRNFSEPLGVFSGPSSANGGGKFSYMFTLTHCVCDKVQHWMDEVVKTSNFFTKNFVICSPENTSSTGATTAPNSSDNDNSDKNSDHNSSDNNGNNNLANNNSNKNYTDNDNSDNNNETLRGESTAEITLVAYWRYDPAKVEKYMSLFPDTGIENASRPLGDFSGLRSENIGGNFSYVFTLTHCDCDQVNGWIKSNMVKSETFTNSSVKCTPNDTSSTGATAVSNSSDNDNTDNNKNTSSTRTNTASNSSDNDNTNNNSDNNSSDNNNNTSSTGTSDSDNDNNKNNNNNKQQ